MFQHRSEAAACGGRSSPNHQPIARKSCFLKEAISLYAVAVPVVVIQKKEMTVKPSNLFSLLLIAALLAALIAPARAHATPNTPADSAPVTEQRLRNQLADEHSLLLA